MKLLLASSPRTLVGFNRLLKIPNIGFCSLAANIDEGLCEIKIADLTIAKNDPYKYFRDLLQSYQPDIVGLSGMIFHCDEILELAKITKEHNKNITVIVGGYYPTVANELIVKSDDMNYFDFLIRGEGEQSFNKFLKAFTNGKEYKDVPSLTYRVNGNFVHNPQASPAKLEDIKPPDRNLRLLKKGFHIFGYPADSIESSRGCAYSCNFCCISLMYGRGYRKYNIERVLDDIRDAQKHGAKAIMFTDDNITLDGKRCIELFDAITNAGLNKIKYLLEASINGFVNTPGLAKALARGGVKWIFLGIENASDEILHSINKSVQLKSNDAFKVVKELRSYGIFIIGGFILGHPDDTKDTLWANYKYALELGVDVPTFSVLTPYPKTGMREELEGINMITNLDNFVKYNGWAANVKTKHLTSDEIFDIIHEMELRYPAESGVIWRIFKKYPWYLIKMGSGWLMKNPGDLLKFFTGFRKKTRK